MQIVLHVVATLLRKNIEHVTSQCLLFLCFQSDPYWTVETLTVRDRSRIGNQTVCSLVEMLRLAARTNGSALLNVRKPPPEHPRYRNWFMDTLWAVQKAGISQKRVRTVGPSIIILWLFKGAACCTVTPVNHKHISSWFWQLVLSYSILISVLLEYCGKLLFGTKEPPSLFTVITVHQSMTVYHTNTLNYTSSTFWT